jgi:carboxyl-terminal processing protease
MLIALLALPAAAQLLPEQKQANLSSFEFVWTTIHDQHWEINPGGLDWQAVGAEFRPRMEQAATTEAAREILREMLARLKQTHFAIFPAPVYQDLNAATGGDGWPGFETQVLDGRVLVTGGSAVPLGWEVLSAEGTELRTLAAKLKQDPAIHELQLERAIAARLGGPVGATRHFIFGDKTNTRVSREIQLQPPRGELSGFGNLPPQHVWFETKKLGETGYIRFNLFLDLIRMMPSFGDAVQACARCDGIIVDLRGNAGGIGAMAMGMAGWFVDKPGQRLGTMTLRNATLNFIINPRAGSYAGPLAILVDGSSASTAEIFAGGLQDLGRARVFGTRTAGAALPSIITRLPNGDGFQYAVANYVSVSGQALEAKGVAPDVEVRLTQETLLAGHDAVLDAALDWIRRQGKQ